MLVVMRLLLMLVVMLLLLSKPRHLAVSAEDLVFCVTQSLLDHAVHMCGSLAFECLSLPVLLTPQLWRTDLLPLAFPLSTCRLLLFPLACPPPHSLPLMFTLHLPLPFLRHRGVSSSRR